MDKLYNALPLVLTVTTWGWDAYAKAHGIPYQVDDWLKGLILIPYAKWTLDKSASGAKKVVEKTKDLIIKKPDEPPKDID